MCFLEVTIILSIMIKCALVCVAKFLGTIYRGALHDFIRFVSTLRAFHETFSLAISSKMLFNTTKAYNYFAVSTVFCSPFISHMGSALLLNSLVQEMKGAKGKYVCF